MIYKHLKIDVLSYMFVIHHICRYVSRFVRGNQILQIFTICTKLKSSLLGVQRKETVINQPMKVKYPSAGQGTDPEFIR